MLDIDSMNICRRRACHWRWIDVLKMGLTPGVDVGPPGFLAASIPIRWPDFRGRGKGVRQSSPEETVLR